MENFIKTINKKRLEGGWYFFKGIVEGKEVQLKGIDLFMQIYKVNGVEFGWNCKTVREFKALLEEGINYEHYNTGK